MNEIKIKVGGKYKAICVDGSAWGGETTEFEYEVVKFDNKSCVEGHYYLIKSENSDYDQYYLDENGEWIDSPELYIKTVCAIKEPVESFAEEKAEDEQILSLEIGNTYIDEDGDKIQIIGNTPSGLFVGSYSSEAVDERLVKYHENGTVFEDDADYYQMTNIIKLAPESIKVDLWINVYKQGVGEVHYTKEDADENKSEMMDFIEQVHFSKEVEVN